MCIHSLARILRASLIPVFFLSTTLILSGCGNEEAAPPGKTGAAPETPSKPGSNYMQDMKNASPPKTK
jgi:hypothetical protein